MSEAMGHDLEDRQDGEGRSLGAILKAAREARRWGIDKIARELHLPVETVGALERDDYSVLPPPTFVRGYVRSYARLLGLPEQEAVDAYHRVVGEGAEPALHPAARGQGEARPASWAGPLGWLLVGMLGIWGYQYWRSSQTSEPVPSPVGLSGPAPEESAARGAGLPADAETPHPSNMPATAVRPLEVAGASPAPSVRSDTPAPAPGLAQPSGQSGQPEVATLVLSFSGDSWASVIDADGKKLLYQTVAKGQVRTVQGKAPFKITLGRPADTLLEYNGQAYDHGYKSNRTSVRFIVPKETAH
ncbi:RodZ domain-containing protein [Methylococcus geothermalis]|uniref:DUF4115 domain-containing protein n=1 Tax=Methylococcus geothermalis TaxID=2681310 RepID=A0A858Q9R7_9GAMM|nr:RodZ family helix-turn-helix domain-containing protein [Methylococcus geothermalis]QJD30426.1 DUF4115 domain-containing protein [Methylococcus geothermalis]